MIDNGYHISLVLALYTIEKEHLTVPGTKSGFIG